MSFPCCPRILHRALQKKGSGVAHGRKAQKLLFLKVGSIHWQARCQDHEGSPSPLLSHLFCVVMTNGTWTFGCGKLQPFKGSTLFLMYSHAVYTSLPYLILFADTACVPITCPKC